MLDLARDFKWKELKKFLKTNPSSSTFVNQHRIGGKSGYTVLHQCALGEAPIELVKLILSLGADINRRSGNGQRPYEVALTAKRDDLYELLKPRRLLIIPTEDWIPLAKHFEDYFRRSFKSLVADVGIEPPSLEVLLTVETAEWKFELPTGGFKLTLKGNHNDGYFIQSEEYLSTDDAMKTVFKINAKGFKLMQ
jgi:ankyrin repeat protein